MSSKEIFILSIILAIVLIGFSLVRDKKSFMIRIFSRGVVGIFVIYIVNACLAIVQVPLNLGVNVYTVCTTAMLGIPGLTLLYGMLGVKFL